MWEPACGKRTALELAQGVVAEKHVLGSGPGLGPRLTAALRVGNRHEPVPVDRLAPRSGVLLAHQGGGHHVPHLHELELVISGMLTGHRVKVEVVGSKEFSIHSP